MLSFSCLQKTRRGQRLRPVQVKYLLLETVEAVHVNYAGSCLCWASVAAPAVVGRSRDERRANNFLVGAPGA